MIKNQRLIWPLYGWLGPGKNEHGGCVELGMAPCIKMKG